MTIGDPPLQLVHISPEGCFEQEPRRHARARCLPRHVFACNDLTMSVAGRRTLRAIEGSYVLDRAEDITEVIPRADVLAVVLGPDGSTVILKAGPANGLARPEACPSTPGRARRGPSARQRSPEALLRSGRGANRLRGGPDCRPECRCS